MNDNRSGESVNIPIDFHDKSSEERDQESHEKARNAKMSEQAMEADTDEQDLSEALMDVEQDDSQSDPVKGGNAALAEAEKQVATLRSEKQALYEQLLRRQAEFDNFRKRMERDRLESQDRIRTETLRHILPIIDNFERALKHAPVRDDEGNDGGLRTGVELIYKQLVDLIDKQGLEPIKAVGQPFDPHLHEAVTTTPTDEFTENTVLEELQRGYLYNGKLVRPATVRVAVRK